MLSQELQLLEEFCAAEVAVRVTVEDMAVQDVSANLFSLTQGACMHGMTWGNEITHTRIFRPSNAWRCLERGLIVKVILSLHHDGPVSPSFMLV